MYYVTTKCFIASIYSYYNNYKKLTVQKLKKKRRKMQYILC